MLGILLLCGALVFGVVRPFFLEMFHIPSESMAGTLRTDDRVLVNKLAYRVGNPRRFDLAALQTPKAGPQPVIKRVVALSGDRVAIRDGFLYVNREQLREPYVDHELTDSTFFGPEKVPAGRVFVLGDNRSDSRDSRHWGPVPEDDLLGRVVARVWPPGRVGRL